MGIHTKIYMVQYCLLMSMETFQQNIHYIEIRLQSSTSQDVLHPTNHSIYSRITRNDKYVQEDSNLNTHT